MSELGVRMSVLVRRDVRGQRLVIYGEERGILRRHYLMGV